MSYYDDGTVQIHHGDARELLAGLKADVIVTDPPYGLEFMGKEWDKFRGANDWGDKGDTAPWKVRPKGGTDPFQRKTPRYHAGQPYQAWCTEWATAALDALPPGGWLLAFGGTRTWHRLACGIEDAGFEVRDTLMWLYGSGFPKSLDVSKAIDRTAGVKREIVGRATGRRAYGDNPTPHAPGGMFRWGDEHFIWENLPSHARDYFTRKAEERVFVTAPATPEAERWQGWGTALKPAWEPIIVARKPFRPLTVAQNVLEYGTGALNIAACRGEEERWPANVVFDSETAAQLPESRFFYTAKAGRSERVTVDGEQHPCVKPLSLMKWLVRLVCPPGGVVLDPFCGSGSTLVAAAMEGFQAVGVEADERWCEGSAMRLRVLRLEREGEELTLWPAAGGV